MGENLKVLSKKEMVHLKANLDSDGASLIKWQDPQVETFIIIHKEMEKEISKSTRKQSIYIFLKLKKMVETNLGF
jgi:hypothetical protein